MKMDLRLGLKQIQCCQENCSSLLCMHLAAVATPNYVYVTLDYSAEGEHHKQTVKEGRFL